MPKAIIIGGGIAGLMIGHELTKRGFTEYTILEASPTKEALLSKSHIYYIHAPIEDLKHLLKEKHIQSWVYFAGKYYDKATPAMSNVYAQRITDLTIPTAIHHIDGENKKGYFPDSGSIHEIMNFYLDKQEVNIHFRKMVTKIDTHEKKVYTEDGDDYFYDFIINTIPMPYLLRSMNLIPENSILKDQDQFKFNPIHTYRSKLDRTQDLHQEIYIPREEDSPFYRMLIYNDTAIAESTEDLGEFGVKKFVDSFNGLLGVRLHNGGADTENYCIKAGRFIPINNTRRKEMITELTDAYNIFSYGRYGTWSYKRTDYLPKDAEDLINIINYKGIKI